MDDVVLGTLGGLVVGFWAGVIVGLADRAHRARRWLDPREPARR